MDAYSYIKNHLFVKLRPSRISGVGVFSIRDIPIDTVLFKKWDGDTGFYPLSQSQLNLLDIEIQSHIKDIFIYSTDFPNDTNIYIKLTNGCHWIYANPYYLVNSGYYNGKSNIDKDSMKSLRLIRVGEELLSNYPRYEKMELQTII